MCGSPPPDGSQADSVRGQFDQTDGYGLALPVRTEIHVDTPVKRCASGGMNVQQGTKPCATEGTQSAVPEGDHSNPVL